MSRPIEVRFWEKVVITPGCWIWLAGTNRKGYGQIRRDRTYGYALVRANRLSWEIHNGPIPVGFDVLHTCDTPRCVNPDHLFLGTQQDNSDDMVSKGRQSRGATHGNSVFSEADILSIRAEYAAGGVTQESLARKYNTYQGQINRIVNRYSWTHI